MTWVVIVTWDEAMIITATAAVASDGSQVSSRIQWITMDQMKLIISSLFDALILVIQISFLWSNVPTQAQDKL